MFIPWKLLKKKLNESNQFKIFVDYRRAREKWASAKSRTKFLRECLANDLIPNFLRFRIPENGCFEQTAVHNFQRRLLRAEIQKADKAVSDATEMLEKSRRKISEIAHEYLPSIILFNRIHMRKFSAEMSTRHSKKLANLSVKQQKPLNGNHDTVKTLTDIKLPQFVVDSLSHTQASCEVQVP